MRLWGEHLAGYRLDGGPLLCRWAALVLGDWGLFLAWKPPRRLLRPSIALAPVLVSIHPLFALYIGCFNHGQFLGLAAGQHRCQAGFGFLFDRGYLPRRPPGVCGRQPHPAIVMQSIQVWLFLTIDPPSEEGIILV